MKLLRLMIATLTLATVGCASAPPPKPTVNVTGNCTLPPRHQFTGINWS